MGQGLQDKVAGEPQCLISDSLVKWRAKRRELRKLEDELSAVLTGEKKKKKKKKKKAAVEDNTLFPWLPVKRRRLGVTHDTHPDPQQPTSPVTTGASALNAPVPQLSGSDIATGVGLSA